MFAIRSKTGGDFRRSGILFKSTEWREVEKPTEAQKNEPNLEVIELTGSNDPRLGQFPLVSGEGETLAKPPVTDEDARASIELIVNEFCEKHALSLVGAEDLKELQADLAKAQADLQKAQGDLTKVTGERDQLQADLTKAQADLQKAKAK